ncbi:tenascin-like [Portunus trituberculatus]|uniref:tenascin-like n=1 Tax=Portunus trituberculatus TaxID=210409 RepID=UPI001E1D1305|nr:tenascin-like [Portunus trituberculatus]
MRTASHSDEKTLAAQRQDCCYSRINLRIMVMRSTLLVVAAAAVAMMFLPANVNASNYLRIDHPHSHEWQECNKDSDTYCYNSPSDCTVPLPDYRCTPAWKTCCAICDSTSCSGTCRAKGGCLEDEFTETECGTYCDCCETCQADNCTGRCVGNPDLCFGGNYINGTCTGGNCTCCVSCGDPDAQCAEAGGVCVGAGNECPCDYFPHPDFGCTSGDCICCVSCYPSLGCIGGHNPGRCVANETMCSMNNEYISSDKCSSSDGSCSCCKTCTPDQICASEGGRCVKRSVGCTEGFRESILGGGCCADECICCIPNPCLSTDLNCTSDAYGTECTSRTSCRNGRLRYMTNDTCPLATDMCCKACIPDTTCSNEGGYCVTAAVGCKRDVMESINGKCCDSDNCVCCIPDPSKTCWNTICLADPNPVVFDSNCNGIGDYKIDLDCGKSCCKKCTPDAQCCNEGGRCYTDGCPADLQQSQTGTCNDNDNCHCCV